jgi:hypothetical protein
MSKSKIESNLEKFPELKKQREKMAEVSAKAREIDGRTGEVLESKRDAEARDGDLLIQAEALLSGEADALPARDYDSELSVLFQQREVVQKALVLQSGRLDEAVRVASNAEYRRLKPRYLAEIKKMVAGISAVEAAFSGMRSIKQEMTEAGLSDTLPNVAWPGLRPGDFQRQREAFEDRLRVIDFAEALD